MRVGKKKNQRVWQFSFEKVHLGQREGPKGGLEDNWVSKPWSFYLPEW